MNYKRNEGKHTDAQTAKNRILVSLLRSGYQTKSGMGYVAYPDYSFRWPQGAAFAVAKIVRELLDDGLLTMDFGHSHCYKLTSLGHKTAQAIVQD